MAPLQSCSGARQAPPRLAQVGPFEAPQRATIGRFVGSFVAPLVSLVREQSAAKEERLHVGRPLQAASNRKFCGPKGEGRREDRRSRGQLNSCRLLHEAGGQESVKKDCLSAALMGSASGPAEAPIFGQTPRAICPYCAKLCLVARVEPGAFVSKVGPASGASCTGRRLYAARCVTAYCARTKCKRAAGRLHEPPLLRACMRRTVSTRQSRWPFRHKSGAQLG